jgi:hypothetical protein
MKKPSIGTSALLITAATVLASSIRSTSFAAEHGELPTYLRDRGTGVPTSMFGTYIREGELLVYPFLEYYRDKDAEYAPQELGHGLDEDFRGEYRATEGLIFLAYGFTKRFAVELEAAIIDATLETAPEDPTAIPDEISESGLGDIEGQLRYRISFENESRPEFFTYFETVFPTPGDPVLIGTQDWEFKLGVGAVKGHSWGTTTFRAAVEYDNAESSAELGEVAFEYLKRLSPAWRIYAGLEGTQDEWELIPEAQWHVSDSIYFKLNSAFGITSKATDWAPEFGVMFSFPIRRKSSE